MRFEATPERGYKAFARIYASWAASQRFYREGIYYKLGYTSLEDYLLRAWEPYYKQRGPHNLLAMIDTWLHCDVSNNSIYQYRHKCWANFGLIADFKSHYPFLEL
ncbi:MAG: hypothetical protein ACYTXC_24490 [Nostoc sp.]